MKPTASKHTILNQICNLIPRNLVPRLASKHGVDKKARSFSPWSHVVAMLHAQLAQHSEAKGNIYGDYLIELTVEKTGQNYPKLMRLVIATVEVFFKQIQQTLQLADFLGHSENAMRWQVWMALLTYVLLRYIGHLGQWGGSFRRLFTLLRGVLFSRLEIFSVLLSCGTARGSPRMRTAPEHPYLPGFERFFKVKR